MTGRASFHPKKSLGQNFLKDPVHRARIVTAADLSSVDAVLEIGAGDGSLTALIAAQAGLVVAVELDDRLMPRLRERFKLEPHVAVVHGDILDMDAGSLMSRHAASLLDRSTSDSSPAARYKVIANLPYYITSHAIRRLLESEHPPSLMVLTVQKEVATRIVAKPPDMSLLAVSVQFYCTAEVVDHIPAGAFRPRPKVDSAVVRMMWRSEPALPQLGAEDFFRVVRAGFLQPRKQLRNSLAAGLGVSTDRAVDLLTAAKVSPQRRAETLAIEEWGGLAVVVAQEGSRDSGADPLAGAHASSETRSA